MACNDAPSAAKIASSELLTSPIARVERELELVTLACENTSPSLLEISTLITEFVIFSAAMNSLLPEVVSRARSGANCIGVVSSPSGFRLDKTS